MAQKRRRWNCWSLPNCESGDIGGQRLNVHATGYRWQARFDLFLQKIAPDDRIVVCCVDLGRGPKSGHGIGKTAYCSHAKREHGALIGIAQDSRSTAQMYEDHPIVLFDINHLIRRQIDWDLIESLKLGNVQRSYSGCKLKTAISTVRTSHVLMFMQWYPDFSKLNPGRWHVIDNFGDDQTIHDLFPVERFPGVADLVDPFEHLVQADVTNKAVGSSGD